MNKQDKITKLSSIFIFYFGTKNLKGSTDSIKLFSNTKLEMSLPSGIKNIIYFCPSLFTSRRILIGRQFTFRSKLMTLCYGEGSCMYAVMEKRSNFDALTGAQWLGGRGGAAALPGENFVGKVGKSKICRKIVNIGQNVRFSSILSKRSHIFSNLSENRTSSTLFTYFQ